jgi:hypothetical protein
MTFDYYWALQIVLPFTAPDVGSLRRLLPSLNLGDQKDKYIDNL